MNKFLLSLATFVTLGLTACAQEKQPHNTNASGTLVAYFSATGTTAKAAGEIAEATGGKLYAIQPETDYTAADLDWHDKRSRSTKEMEDATSRPPLRNTLTDMSSYEVVFIGYPIWWNQAPRIINTFIESHELKGKTIIPFATSGGSSISNSVKELKAAYPDLDWSEGKLLNHADSKDIQEWVKAILP